MKVYYAGQKAIELVFRYINHRLEVYLKHLHMKQNPTQLDPKFVEVGFTKNKRIKFVA